ncbi:MAG: molecular chaperone HtpG [Deferribacterota bacterium]|nr:molecular chaperone HtpG [Deferribacterota bacterium]
MAEEFTYKAETKQLLNLLINSLYTKKDIFLRELISNASDAIDRLKIYGITNSINKFLEIPYEINIKADSKNRVLIVSDNGIGMTKDEAINNLGTLAHSGSKQYLEAIKNKEFDKIPELIGQFGVGFYAAFMVADKVEVISKSAISSEKGVKWISKGGDNFYIEEIDKEGFGTDIYVYLKKGEEIYLTESKIRELVKTYSDFIDIPIYFVSEDGKKVKLNSQIALWRKNKSEIKKEDYYELYRHHSIDNEDPLDVIHIKAEGLVEYSALLYIPSKRPFNIFAQDYEYGPALYVKKILIMNHCKDLLPFYLRFIKGVVEVNDLPLNVSREYLQSSREITTIKNNLVKKILEHLENMKKNKREEYVKFYKTFGRILKEGIIYDVNNREKIGSLILAQSTKTDNDEHISLDEYIERMPVKQKYIYFMPGKDMDSIKNSPYIEAFKEKDIEVLLMSDDFDDLFMSQLNSYKGKMIKSVLQSDILEYEKKDSETYEKYKCLIEYIKSVLKDKAIDVQISRRLKNYPAIIVNKSGLREETIDAVNMANNNTLFKDRVLEINPDNEIIKYLMHALKEGNNSKTKDIIYMLYYLALFEGGYNIDNLQEFKNTALSVIEKSIASLKTT